MPNLKLKYKLTTNQFIKVEKLVFVDYEVELINDQCQDDSNCFMNKEPITVIPDDEYMNIYLLANGSNGGEGFEWSLNVWINDILKTKAPIEVKVNAQGRADYNGKIKWS